MAQYGTTNKQFQAAIQRLKDAGMKAWPAGTGNHYLWVVNAKAFPEDPAHCGRISVPRVSQFIEQFGA